MSRRTFLPGLLACALLAACADDEIFSGSFDTPAHVAVLDVGAGGPFTRAVGFTADRHGGLVRVLDLDSGRYVNTDRDVSFVRSPALSLGAARVLGELAPWAPTDDRVDLFAIDHRHKAIVQVPYVRGGVAGDPDQVQTSPRAQTFLPAAGSADGPSPHIGSVLLRQGLAAHETWTATFDRGSWRLVGSRSGPQSDRAVSGVPWLSDNTGLQFVIDRDGAQGDQILLELDNGTTERVLDGDPLQLTVAADMGQIILAWRDTAGDHHLSEVTPDALDLTDCCSAWNPADVPLDLAWSDDATTLYVGGETRQAGLSTGGLLAAFPRKGAATTWALPWPVEHVAVVTLDAEGDTAPQTIAFLHPVGQRTVWRMDLATGQLLDVNTVTPEVDGMTFTGPVLGLAAISTTVERPEREPNGDFSSGKAVAVSLQTGEMRFLEAESGCQLEDFDFGPRTEIDGGGFGTNGDVLGDLTDPSFDIVPPATAWFEVGEDGLRHITVHPCAGVAIDEAWTLTYDSAAAAWRVEGEFSGEQQAMAIPDVRYTSDKGEISFVPRSGATPPPAGANVTVFVQDGAIAANGDTEGNGTRDIPFEHLGQPAVFHRTIEDEVVPFVVAPASGTDVVVQVDPRTGIVSDAWD